MAKIENVNVRARAGKPSSPPVPSAPPELKITKPGSVEHLKLVLFGPPKTKKTITSVSGSGRKLLILTEPEGDLSLTGREDIDVVRPTNGTELYEIIQALHGGAVKDYEWIVLDSVTFAFEIIGRAKVTKAIENNQDLRRPYGDVGASLVQMVMDLVALKTNVIFITQLKEGSDDEEMGPEEGNFPITLAITPMVYKILAPAVSLLGRTFKKMFVDAQGNKQVQFMVSFEDYGRSPAGSRIEGVELSYQDLNLDELVKAIKKGASK